MKTDLSNMSAAELDELIADAAKRRAELEPKVTEKAPDPWTALVNPAWSVSLVEQGSLMRIRHNGLGWVCFVIPPTERAVLLTTLLQHALIVRPDVKLTVAPAAGGSTEVGGGSVH